MSRAKVYSDVIKHSMKKTTIGCGRLSRRPTSKNAPHTRHAKKYRGQGK
jgi:hypothetical protein